MGEQNVSAGESTSEEWPPKADRALHLRFAGFAVWASSGMRTRSAVRSRLKSALPVGLDRHAPGMRRPSPAVGEGGPAALAGVPARDGAQPELPPAVLTGREGAIPRALASACLERDSRPWFAVNREREIRWTNGAARKSLRPPLPAYLQDNRLHFRERAHEARFAVFFDALDGEPRRLPVAGAQNQGILVLSGCSVDVAGERLAAIDVGLPKPPLSVRESGLAEGFGLTPAESEILEALVLGEVPNTIAARLGLSIHTVRTHIRHVYAKLSVRSQTQLLRLAFAYCGA